MERAATSCNFFWTRQRRLSTRSRASLSINFGGDHVESDESDNCKRLSFEDNRMTNVEPAVVLGRDRAKPTQRLTCFAVVHDTLTQPATAGAVGKSFGPSRLKTCQDLPQQMRKGRWSRTYWTFALIEEDYARKLESDLWQEDVNALTCWLQLHLWLYKRFWASSALYRLVSDGGVGSIADIGSVAKIELNRLRPGIISVR